jgi:RNA polymerase sigma factor (sigma-70 family)
MTVVKYSHDEIIKGIGKRDNAVLHYVYDTYYPVIREFVIRNSGQAADAQDVFQEALVVIFRRTREGDIQLQSSFINYLYTISRYIWLKILKRRKMHNEKISEIIRPQDLESDEIREIDLSLERKVFQFYFSKLGKDCREILTHFYHELSFREIARKLGLASEEYARKRKHACKEQLIKMIKSDPDVHYLLED